MKKIAVLGLGKVGSLAAELLHGSGFDVTGIDLATRGDLPFPVVALDLTNTSAVEAVFTKQDAVLSCLPFHLNISVAEIAHRAGIHYFDLTEDVPTTNRVIELSKTSKGLMAPQCGLAPGFIGIVGASLIAQLDECRSCKMRVGALPQNPTGLMGYSFNWSPEGVVNEYLNDCEVIEDGARKLVSPMEWMEDIYIDGMKLEAFTTSGGLGTMCETYLGKVANIDYKTMRYPGHAKLMNFFFHELLMRDRRKEAGEILINAKPPVEDDIVYVHASAEGTIDGKLQRREFVRAYRPVEVAGKQRTAISWTTAGSVVSIIEMVRDGALPATGFLKQEEIGLKAFLATSTGSLYAAN
ncbi:saccharopine dehydrogenase-like NADP-dependent oxidoreductase [Litoreibacter halocynthiae]|uniref:Saccharopine dehydrogenase-like NADP-dependent oxidoreductase n=1 Tax=Litoreibacter halocynthiae TaxID=1242689 RepID=A0A4R7LJK0_9RHOB|nr:saccharopine dehydrogenase C-terminal domain-containing protein [Litoreibacter halocynthiae]TDT74796.1 saccharopine dehydrogenase-like NADP-dependent oxidoreductase [Litoreibacter halocynthiae]